MAENKWSPEQQQVIDDRQSDLLVSAAAGSGKTAVLTEHILQLILEGSVDIDQLLVVTFTNAAAGEMRERIAGKLNDAYAANPQNKRLARQKLLIHNASIMTIDSFCLSVLREFFHEIDLDPAFRIGQSAELELIYEETLNKILEDKYAAGEDGFICLVECLGSHKGDEGLVEAINDLYRAASAHPYPIKWLEEELAAAREPGLTGDVRRQRTDLAVSYLNKLCLDAAGLVSRARERSQRQGPVFDKITEVLGKDLDLYERGSRLTSYEKAVEYYSLLADKASGFANFPSIRKECDLEEKEAIKEIRTKAKDSVKKALDSFFSLSEEELDKELEVSGRLGVALLELVIEFAKAFFEAKKAKNVLDFNDLEHLALEILETEGSAAAGELRSRYKKIFVDEYQDSNMIQESIVRAIVGDEGRGPVTFMVGDVKQSIYKFRMAKPELFISRMKAYEEEPQKGHLISLHKNFRSRPEVLDSTNDVFKYAMRESMGGIDYDDDCALNAGAEVKEEETGNYTSEIIVVSRGDIDQEDLPEVGSTFDQPAGEDQTYDGPGEDEDGGIENEALRKLEARAAAKRIRELVEVEKLPVFADKKVRPVGYGDIVVLLRVNKGWLDYYLEAFEEEGIPAYSDASSGFLETFEIRTILNYLRILDNPRQDIPLAAVLHSPLAGFNTEELAQIRLLGGDKQYLYDGLCLYGASEELAGSGLYEKVRTFLDRYERLADLSRASDIDLLLGRIYDETGFYNYCTALTGGARRASNLELLMNYAAEYEASSYSGLFSFVRYVEQLLTAELDLEEAVSAEAVNAVRIMTIHKSKGLEFPVVFVGGMGKALQNQDARKTVLASADFGLELPYVDSIARISRNTLMKKMMGLQMKLDYLGEEERLLYVAMTRAREKLILIGSLNKPEANKRVWESQAELAQSGSYTYSYLSSQKSYYDMVCPAALLCPKDFSFKYEDPASLLAGRMLAQEMTQDRRSGFEAGNYGPADEAIKRELEYGYPYPDTDILPIKLSVSDLKKASMLEEYGYDVWDTNREADLPVLYPEAGEEAEAGGDMASKLVAGEEDKAKAGERTKVNADKEPKSVAKKDKHETPAGALVGTLYHKVMQFLPFDLEASDGAVRDFIESLVGRDIISKEEAQKLRPERFTAFLAGDLSARMARADAAGKLRREQPFVLGVRACDINKEKYGDFEDLIPVQGVIDALFEEEGRLVIVDYKTDRIEEGQEEELVKRYKAQLDYYGEAASRILGQEVGQKLLYSLRLGRVVEV